MKIKVGDNVVVISGSRKDKNKQGKVLNVFKETNKILVEGINIKKKITNDTEGKKTILDIEFPINISNVMFFDIKAKKGSRVGYTKDENGKKIRVAKSSGTNLK